MSILDQLNNDMKEALKAKDKARLEVIRGLKSDISYKEIEAKGGGLSEEDVIGVITSAAKRRRDSIEQFRNGGREDLASKEEAELEIITTYLPKQMSDAEIAKIVEEAIAASGATGPSDTGKVMKEVMPRVKGKADGNRVKQIVAEKLAG